MLSGFRAGFHGCLARRADELAVDVSPWLRPDAACSPGRVFCHTCGQVKSDHVMVPGWPYSVIAALEEGRTSWTAALDAVRLDPNDDVAAVTAAQVRDLVVRLVEARHWKGLAKEAVVRGCQWDLQGCAAC